MQPVEYDIVIAGGGNAALCAAITAAEMGARVLMLEAAPKAYRGGNSRHTRNFRCMHDGPLSVLKDSYTEEEYFDDLIKVTGGKTDEALARMVIRRSQDCLPWMEAQLGGRVCACERQGDRRSGASGNSENGIHTSPPISIILTANCKEIPCWFQLVIGRWRR